VLPNPDGHWRPGLFVTAKIAVDEIDVPLLVPKAALQTVEDRLSVFVQTDEGFAPRPVTLGRSTETYAEVTKGLQPGQRYVTKGAFTLKAELVKGSFGDGHVH
jgi:cobalt-zinc-cadmium efflux system membrane fusion protein